MKKLLFTFVLLLVASCQVDDWKVCADSIIKLERDLVDLAYSLQVAVTGTFIPDVQKIIGECKFKNPTPNDWATCATSIFSMGQDIVDFGKKVEETIKEVIIVDVVNITKVCKKEVVDAQVNDWPTCLEDISKIVEIADRIKADIKQFNFQQLVKDIQELYNTVQKAIQDCTKSNLKLEFNDSDWPTCLEDISKIVEIADRIKADIKQFNFQQLVKDIQELYNTVQKAIQDCTKQEVNLEASDSDWPTCLEDISKIVEIADRIKADIKQFNFQQLVKDIQELYNTVQKAIQDCTKQSLELSFNDWPTCLDDISKIVEIADKIKADIKQFNFQQLVKDVQELYNAVQKAIQDCTKQQETLEASEDDWPTCLEDISKIVEIADRIKADIKQFNFQQLVKDIQELYNTVQKAIQDCTKQSLELNYNDWPTCLDDISKIVEIADKIKADIKQFNFQQLVKDVQELYNAVQKAIQDCTKQQEFTLEASESDWPTCLEDIAKIVEIADKIKADIKQFNFQELVKDIQELYNIVQKAIQDCTKQQLELSGEDPNDWKQCLEDIDQIAKLAKEIEDDIKHFNIIKLTKDIKALYDLVQKAIVDCQK